MPGIMTRAQFTDLDDSNFRKIFSDEFGQYKKTYYDTIFQMETSDRNEEKYTGVDGHGLMQPISENGTAENDARIPDFDITLTNQSFSLNAEISYERFQDDRFGEIKKEAVALGRSAKKSPDVYAADALKRGFLTTDRFANSMLAGDGLRFFSTQHLTSTADSTVMSNASATGVTLTENNLETAMVALREQLNARNLIAGCEASHLIVPPKLAKQARIITESTQRPDTADNDINIYKGGSLTVVEWPELGAAAGGSDTAWYLIDKSMHKLIFQWREQPNIFPVEFKKNPYRYVYDCMARWEFGMQNWRGVWGSKGDSSAYSS